MREWEGGCTSCLSKKDPELVRMLSTAPFPSCPTTVDRATRGRDWGTGTGGREEGSEEGGGRRKCRGERGEGAKE